MQNFWERIARIYYLPCTLNFILKEDIDIDSTIIAEITFLIRNGYIKEEKNNLKIINQELFNLSKVQQYLMRVINKELDFKEKIFKALVLEDGKNKKIILTNYADLTLKFLICFIPFLLILILFNILEIFSNLDLEKNIQNIFEIIKIISCFLTLFVYIDTKDRFKKVCSKNFILTFYSNKDKKYLNNYLKNINSVTPNLYLNIFLNKDNSKHRFLKYIK